MGLCEREDQRGSSEKRSRCFKLQESTTPKSSNNPICAATRQAGTGANVYPTSKKTVLGIVWSAYIVQQMRIATTRHPTEAEIQISQAENALVSPIGRTMNSDHGGVSSTSGCFSE